MTKLNPYFSLYGQYSSNSNEQDLIHGFVEETVQIHGFDVCYILRKDVNEDRLFGEDTMSAFEESFNIEMQLESAEGFDGDDSIVDFMGFAVQKKVNLLVSQRRFTEETSMNTPREGDLIWFKDGMFNNGLWEVRFVDEDTNFFPLNTLPVFHLHCQLFDKAGETFGTGQDILDDEMSKFNEPDTLESLEDIVGSDNEVIETEGDNVILNKKNPWGI